MLYNKLKKMKNKTILLKSFLLIFILAIGILVYFTGGTKNSYAHLIYLPIVISGYFYGLKGGIIAAVISGFVLGPLMPIDSEIMLMQQTQNWLFRMVFLIIIGSFVGYLFANLEQQIMKNRKLAYFDQETGLPNKSTLKNVIENKINNEKEFHLFILTINNLLNIYKLTGFSNFPDYVDLLVEYIKEYPALEKQIYYINENHYGIILDKDRVDDLVAFTNDFLQYLDQPLNFGKISIYNNFTIGITTYPDYAKKTDRIINQAFLAIKKAKNKKLPFWHYEDINFQEESTNLDLLAEINKSIQNDNFEIHYQPKINLKNQSIQTFEALIRWNHPGKGYISPAEFIPLVEKSSLIEPLTEWVIKAVLADIKKFKANNNSLEYDIAINISARNLQQPNFVELLINYLKEYNVDPQNFSIELTETDLMVDIENNINKLDQLKEKGINIYLDDFGKGYSSLKYLKEIPIDYIKIDQFFIENLTEDQKSFDIVYSIIELAHALNIEVVAEGVETEAQLKVLKDIDCDYGQGYLFARPDSKEKIIKYLEKAAELNYEK
ncbi:EAL domain-containing protein [Halanaerobium sp. Z-7514]|uniref:EAL domain-containing protein n=1 Tax=Halanaerobium polyolivorans TaxID=2886943 RepID=A0AAW4WSC5_9FIRM|nr:EAL domain-containing protein [Halanaerobium polyolivorans]MCC3143998.1 EAL domain-containing protein [Halanaerobium polyolivorans]